MRIGSDPRFTGKQGGSRPGAGMSVSPLEAASALPISVIDSPDKASCGIASATSPFANGFRDKDRRIR
jgi:hypothetical protein